MSKEQNTGIGFFERYLIRWMVLCMVAGVQIGKDLPVNPDFLGKFTVYPDVYPQHRSDMAEICPIIWESA